MRLVEDSLPPGAAGVLINRSHAFRDLMLVLGPDDRRLFDRIDGRRAIDGIVNDARGVDCSDARVLFERLWRYDQVVFDMSDG
jgi:hypothetical protein